MNVDLRTEGVPLTRAQRSRWLREIHATFQRLEHRVKALVLRLQAPTGRTGHRDCVVEVHMADGHVERIEERQRHIGALLRRALRSAWSRVLRWLDARRGARPVLSLPATRPALLPAPGARP